MNDYQPDKVELTVFLNSFINHFSITHFFIKPVPREYYPVIMRKVITDKNNPQKNVSNSVPLGSEHYNLLWLINELSKNTEKLDGEGRPVVELKQLQRVFFWYTKPEYSYLQRLSNMARRLCQTGFLDSVKKQTSYYWLTDDGRKLLEDLRSERKKYLTKFFEVSGVKEELYSKILETCQGITPVLWQTIIRESESIKIPTRPKIEGENILVKP
jgi:hypothetical protein